MKIKPISLLAILMCAIMCLFSFTSCDIMDYIDELAEETVDTSVLNATEIIGDTDEKVKDTEKASETEAVITIDASKWAQMISEASFENYTLDAEGVMTVIQNGVEQAPSDVKQRIKVTADKIAISLSATDTETGADDSEDLVFDGDIAEAQKLQYSQLFMAMLKDFSNFTYDAETGTYVIPETVNIEMTLKAISIMGDAVEMFDAPTKIEMREASVTVSEDGKLLKLVCDYTQTMDIYGAATSTAGKIVWSFSDYGTTVIE